MSEIEKRCGLCNHEMTMERCGSAAVGDMPLCHAESHSCYHQWTVYGARAAVEQVRAERGIDRRHDSGADSGALGEDEERDRAER